MHTLQNVGNVSRNDSSEFKTYVDLCEKLKAPYYFSYLSQERSPQHEIKF